MTRTKSKHTRMKNIRAVKLKHRRERQKAARKAAQAAAAKK